MADVISTCSENDTSANTSNGGQWYISLTTWEAAAQTRHATTPNREIVECYDDYAAGFLADEVTVTGWTNTTAENNPVIRPAAGQGHDGSLTGGFTVRGTDNDTIAADQDFISIQGIRVEAAGTRACVLTSVSGAQNALMERLVLVGGVMNNYCLRARAATSVTVRNVIAMATSGSSLFRSESGDTVFESCTAVGNASINNGFNITVNTAQIKNCVALETVQSTYTGVHVGLNNAADDGAAQGTNPVQDITTADFVNYTGDTTGDYKPATGGKLDGAGADLSLEFTNDIAGNTRSVPWEIGAYEIAAAALTFSLSPDSGPLPAGLSVNPTTGNIEGTPTESGTFPNIIVRGSE